MADFIEGIRLYEKKIRGQYISIVIKYRYLKVRKMRGPDLESILTN